MALVPYVEKTKAGNTRTGPRSYPEPPSDWEREERARASEGYEGKIDIFYYDPDTHRQFRSKKSVWQKLRNDISNFEFENVPEEISWILDNPINEWSAYEGEKKVPDTDIELWAKTANLVSCWDNFGASTYNDDGDKTIKVDAEEKYTEGLESECHPIDIYIDFKPLN